MDTERVFLEKFRSAESSNTSGGLNVSLKGKKKFLPFGETYAVISQNEQYNKERLASQKVRLTAQVNVIASNVLFNDITEVVYEEGSPNVKVLNYKQTPTLSKDVKIYGNKEIGWFHENTFTYPPKDKDTSKTSDAAYGDAITNATRDTQLTGKGFVYHCGRDIFNNHILRSTSFKTVTTPYDESKNNQSTNPKEYFNTICDMMRDVDGKQVEEYVLLPMDAGNESSLDDRKKQLHLYINDDILPFDDCVESKLITKYNGWVGFENVAKIPSYEDFDGKDRDNDLGPEYKKPMGINKVICDKNGGDFIDMYPTRDLFLFPPLYNEYRQRAEKNWECCVTYPCSSITSGLYISGENGFLNERVNSMKTIYFNENTMSDNGVRQIVMYSIAKHGLVTGDTVNLYVSSLDGYTELLAAELTVSTVVDDFIFVINNDGLRISDEWVDLDAVASDTGHTGGTGTITIDDRVFKYSPEGNYYTKEGDAAGTKYYVVENRWVNFSDEYRSLSYKKVSGGIEVDYYVRIFSRLPNFKFAKEEINSVVLYDDNKLPNYITNEYEFDNHQSKLAFAKNIYSDQVGQVVFTDDIDLSYLKDNLGRPLTSIYLSFFKTNKGYKEWYGWDEDTNVGSENVEFSHCFGPLTCAFEMSDESLMAKTIPSIKNINNCNSVIKGLDCGKLLGNSEHNEVEIDYYNNKYFYGDIAYYDSANVTETVIQPILHRFNTAQRESSNSKSNVYFSQFNIDEITSDDFDTSGSFTIRTESSYRKYNGASNRRQEGYYYIPHYEVPVRTFGRLASITPDFLTLRSMTRKEGVTLVSVVEKHFLSKGDKTMLMYINPDTGEQTYYTLVTESVPTYKSFTCKIYDEDWNEVNLRQILPSSEYRLDYTLFKIDNIGEEGARLIKDGTCRFVWRPIVQNGDADEALIENYPFTNGAFYINKGIDLMVRRQDPDNRYGLYTEIDIIGNIEDINDEDNYVKEDEITC